MDPDLEALLKRDLDRDFPKVGAFEVWEKPGRYEPHRQVGILRRSGDGWELLAVNGFEPAPELGGVAITVEGGRHIGACAVRRCAEAA